jgi:hypothetical protein
MSNHLTTPKFNSEKCFDSSVTKMYQKACENSKHPIKCTENLSSYCKNHIQTEKDFKIQTNLLNCYNQHCSGQPDEECMNYCSSNNKK